VLLNYGADPDTGVEFRRPVLEMPREELTQPEDVKTGVKILVNWMAVGVACRQNWRPNRKCRLERRLR
jgi:hypothetical protein